MLEPAEVHSMIARLILREGGFVDHPEDAGGPTKFGITRATLADWRKRPVLSRDVEQLSSLEACAIYEAKWFDHPRLRLRRWPYRDLAEVVLDGAVMFSLGRSMSVKWAQATINDHRPANTQLEPIGVDGWAGPMTLRAMFEVDEQALVNGVIARRCRKHGRVISGRNSQAAFAAGWLNRATAWLIPGER